MRIAWLTILATLTAMGLLAASAPAGAQPALGTLLFADADNDRIYDIRDGGSLLGDPGFARGIFLAQDVCQGPDGDIFATELITGAIKLITAGGSFLAGPEFATGLDHPRGLACSDSQILVAEHGSGSIVDATAGGDLSAAPRWAVGLPDISDLYRDSSGTLWASTENGVWNVTSGGDFTFRPAHIVGGGDLRGMAEFEGALLVADILEDQVVDITAGGLYATRPVFATLNGPRHLVHVPGVGLLAAKIAEVVDISNGIEAPFADDFSEAWHGGFAYIGTCGPRALTTCRAASKASLSISEKKAGKEKWKASLSRFDAATTLGDLGDPANGTTTYALCLYDAADDLVAEVAVQRPLGALCGPKDKACWQAKGDRGFRYKDPAAGAGGARKLTAKTGRAGKGKIQLQAGNRASHDQSGLQTGVTALLAGETDARMQLYTSDGACFDAELDVRKADGEIFRAKGN